MNYIKHLTGFFERMIYEDSLNPTHINLYIALFQFWNIKRFTNPIHISREETMRLSKISSIATYHKCMRDLHEKNYVIYEPSFNPYRGSKVTIINLELTDKDVQKTVRKHTIKEPSTKQLAEHLVEPTNEPSINDSKLSLKQLSFSIRYSHLDKSCMGIFSKKKIRKGPFPTPTIRKILRHRGNPSCT
jgi:hypothetical protein